MTKAELIEQIAQNTDMTKKNVTGVVEAVFDTIAGALKKREKVQIVGFGTFEPRRRKARTARNPRTQETIRIGASWSLGFRPGKQLKDMVAGTTKPPAAKKKKAPARKSRAKSR